MFAINARVNAMSRTKKYWERYGSWDRGIISDVSCWKRVTVKSMVMHNEMRSPPSAGKKKDNRTREERSAEGITKPRVNGV